MNTDIRIDTQFLANPKTKRLIREAGPDALRCLIQLWSWAAMNRPEGDLSGLDRFGCINLSGRIAELRQGGANVTDRWVKTVTGKRIKRYFIAS